MIDLGERPFYGRAISSLGSVSISERTDWSVRDTISSLKGAAKSDLRNSTMALVEAIRRKGRAASSGDPGSSRVRAHWRSERTAEGLPLWANAAAAAAVDGDPGGDRKRVLTSTSSIFLNGSLAKSAATPCALAGVQPRSAVRDSNAAATAFSVPARRRRRRPKWEASSEGLEEVSRMSRPRRKRDRPLPQAESVDRADCQPEAASGIGRIWSALDCVGTGGEGSDYSRVEADAAVVV